MIAEEFLLSEKDASEKRKAKYIPNPNVGCPQIKNHSAILYKKCIFLFGGYDGKKNHNLLHMYDIMKNEWTICSTFGKEPEGRNGHTATLIENKMYMIGGWLGSGTYAAVDVYVLNLDNYEWQLLITSGISPGPCNMHSSDLIGKTIYVFRGGDGKDYLNDLHIFNSESRNWKLLSCEGNYPPPRANHSSAVHKNSLYIFGGWDGCKRLNDIYVLDVENLIWNKVMANGNPPSPRAGMSLCVIKSQIFLFGGSGPSGTCFNDLQAFDPVKRQWIEIEISENSEIKPRAGHSMSVFDDKLYIMGGSYGQQYYKDFYIINTDPFPEIKNHMEDSQQKLKSGLRDYCNSPEFSDILFMVEGRPFYGHKMVLSILCEKFKGMFSSGMKESNEDKIVINHISYPIFAAICQYLYTGEVHFGADTEGQELSMESLIEFLSVSDEFMLDEIKYECEKHLVNLINEKSINTIYLNADKYNAFQLKLYCEWYLKRLGQEE